MPKQIDLAYGVSIEGGNGTAPSDFAGASDPYIHVHVCIHCESAFRREECSDQAQLTGIYRCSHCGSDSPLNLGWGTRHSIPGCP
jgi:hypothetical protein